MDKQLINKLVEAATDIIEKRNDGVNHTVGAAVATKDGKIIPGVNLYHFTGGPCGEIVALANAITAGEKDLIAVVAVGDRGRNVLAPCGRCRQILFEYYPDMFAIVAKNGEYVAKPVRELLPDVYDWNAEQIENVAE